MPLHPIYRDFIKFLNELDKGEDPWDFYQACYLHPHKELLLAYWRTFKWMDLDQVKQRVRRIKKGDYSALESLLAQEDPEKLAVEALRRCEEIIPAPQEPDIYLIVGFFSADGFVMEFNHRAVIAVGLERFRDFSSLGIILAHEYCHYLQYSMGSYSEQRTLGEVLLSEGSAAVFSELAFPEKPLYKHLFLSRARLNWCLENFPHLMGLMKPELHSPRMIPLLFRRGNDQIPPRVGNYLGYRIVKEYLLKFGREGIRDLICFKDITQVLENLGLGNE